MEQSKLPDIIRFFLKTEVRRSIFFLILSFFAFISSFAQPAWNSGPAITPNPISIDLNFNIDRASKVYYFIITGDYAQQPASSVKSISLHSLPYGSIVANGQINYTTGNYSTEIFGELANLSPNTQYTIQIVAEDQDVPNSFSTVSKTTFYTLSCPPINIAFNWSTPNECVNKGSKLTLKYIPGDDVGHDPNVDGLWIGTQFFIDWGDGVTTSWQMTAAARDSASFSRSHTYTNTTDCNFEPYTSITSVCNPLIIKENATFVVVHGLDTQGDGVLQIVNAADGLSTIEICEGNTHTITLQDMSTWNCLDPTWNNSDPAPPNDDPRPIQWLYGVNNAGGFVGENTIGQVLNDFTPVNVGGNDVVRNSNGYIQPVISPAAYQGELSQAIIIPSTCRAGEWFNVYLRNWNKCNPYPSDPPEWTMIQIRVVAAPAPPDVTNRTICFGDVTTLTISHGTPAGTLLSWYENADKTGFITNGTTYTPNITIPGVYTYYVADQGNITGNLCEGPVAPITLTVIQTVDDNTIGDPQTICSGTAPLALTGSDPSGGEGLGTYTFRWEESSDNSTWINIPGAISKDYAPPALTESKYFRRVVTSGPCDNFSDPLQIIVRPTPVATVTGATSQCQDGSSPNVRFTNPQSSPITVTYKINNGPDLTVNVNASTYRYVPAPTDVPGTFKYEIVNVFYQTAPSCLNTSVTSSTTITIRPTPTATISGETTVCRGGPSPVVTITNPQSLAVRVTYNINGSGSTTVVIDPDDTYDISVPTGTAGEFDYNLTSIRYHTTPACTHVISGTATITVRPTPVVNITGSTTVCRNGASPNITFTNSTSLPLTVTYNINGSGTYSLPIVGGGNSTVAVPTGTAGSFTYNLVSAEYQTAPSCPASISGSATVVVRPTPTATIAGATAVCQNAASPELTFTNPQALPVTVTYNINGSGTNTVDIPASGTATVAAATGTAGTFVYNLVSVAYQVAPTCSNNITGSATITVNASPAPAITGLNDVCADQTGVVYTTVDDPSNTYTWDISGGVITDGVGTHSITVTWGAAGNGWVRVTETNPTPCTTTTANYDVIIQPGAPGIPSIVVAPTDICRDGTITIDVTDEANANSYIWDFSWDAGTNNATTAVSEITIDLAGVAVGTYTVTVQAVNGCGASAWMPAHSFDINDKPDLSPLGADVCSDVATGITLSIANSGAYCSGITYNITNIADGSLSYSAGNPVTGTDFAANEISNDAWTNKTAASVNVVYTIVPVSTQGCSGVPENVTVKVNPEPDLKNLNKPVCSDEATGITLSDEHGLADRFNIVSITPQAGLTAATGNATAGADQLAAAIANDKFTNKTAVAHTVTYAIIPRINGGCIGDQENVVVTVNPEPDLKNLNKPVCSDAATGITLSDEHGLADRFEIVSITPQAGLTAAAGNATTGAGKLANAIVNDKWTNKTAGSLTVTYAIIPRIDGGCIGDQENVVLTVNPEPDLKDLNKPVCSDEATGITLSDEHSLADRFNIVSITPQAGLTPASGNATAGPDQLANAIVNDKFTNKTSGSLTVTYIIIPRINGGCIGDQENVVVTIYPEPDLKDLDKSVCSDEVTGITLSDEHALANRFNIVSITLEAGLAAAAGNATAGPDQLASVIANDKFTNKTATTLTVTYKIIPGINGGCTGDQEDVVVTVNPEPDLKDFDKPVCSTVPIGVILSDEHNLADRFEIVSITPDVSLTGDPGNASTGPLQSADAIKNDKWTNLTANPLKVIYAVIPRINGGCIGDQENIEVTISPEPDLSDLNTTVCSGVAIGVTLSDVNGLADQFDIVTITAEAGLTPGGSNAVIGTGKAANYISSDIWINTTSGDLKVTYEVMPSIGGVCYGQAENIVITVRPPVIPGSITGNTAICYGTDAPVIANQALASGGDGNISYSWYYTENLAAIPGSADWDLIPGANGSGYDPGVLINPTKFVRKAQDGSCPDEVYSEMITININPLPVTSPITGPSVLCEDATNKIYQVVSTPGSTYAWTVPASLDNTMAPGLDNLYFIIVDAVMGMATLTDTIYVTETITSTGCVGKPVKFHVNVVDIVPGVVVSGPTSLCLGDTAVYFVPDNTGSTYSWSIPPGAYIISDPNSHSIEVKFKMSVTGHVSVIENSNGVCNTIHTEVTVTVNPLPAIFNLTAPVAYCDGEEGVTITLSGSQVGVNYQLYNSSGADGAPLPGSGSALTWP